MNKNNDLSKDEKQQLAIVIENQKSAMITKKITFNKETYKNLITIASREYFDSKLKSDAIYNYYARSNYQFLL